MNRTLLTLCASVLLALFMAAPAEATVFRLVATLSGGEEVTATGIGLLTGAFGEAEITVDTDTGTITWDVRVWNLPSGVTAAHIHVGARGVNGPIIVDFTPTANLSNDFSITGSATFSQIIPRPDQGIRSAEDGVQAILGLNGYVNVHSRVNPGGEIRGQLRLKP
jgi:hypothetical protein